MPRPSSSSAPVGHLDHQGRHRRGRALQGESAPPEDPWDAGGDEATGEDAADEDGPNRVRLLSVPESLRSVDVQVGGRAVRGLLLLAVVVLLVLGGRWWWVAQGAGAVAVPTAVAGAGEEAGTPVPGSDGAVATDPSQQHVAAGQPAGPSPGAQAPPPAVRVVVHVVGEVRRPGVVELPAGSRVTDAVEAVGGLTDAADHASLNLARPLVDGEQVWVGAPGEEPPPGVAAPVTPGAGPPGAGGSGGGAAPSAAPPLVNLNTATQAELEELPGIGPVTAGHILAWRDQHGRFTVVDELMEVSGIGERTFARLEPLVTVGG